MSLPKILNFGSLNIDYVYQVPRFVRPGETLSCSTRKLFPGGKGGNQSVALAKASAEVFHAGKVGEEGRWLKDHLKQDGVNVDFIKDCEEVNGHAVIQVNSQGQNCIILYGGTNHKIEVDQIDETLSHFNEGDYLLLQNEINLTEELISKAYDKKMIVCINPAPMDEKALSYSYDKTSLLILNETEAEALCQQTDPHKAVKRLSKLYPNAELLLTLGEKGVLFFSSQELIELPAKKVKVVDTTAAGDTFIGYFIASKTSGKTNRESLEIAIEASSLCISVEGAQSSIPTFEQVMQSMHK